jgi:hypothetical protein
MGIGVLSSMVMQPGRDVDNSPPSSVEVKNVANAHPLFHTFVWYGA